MGQQGHQLRIGIKNSSVQVSWEWDGLWWMYTTCSHACIMRGVNIVSTVFHLLPKSKVKKLSLNQKKELIVISKSA